MSILPKQDVQDAFQDLRVVYSSGELNNIYQRYDNEWNCLKSNWDWFVTNQAAQDFIKSVEFRIDQN